MEDIPYPFHSASRTRLFFDGRNTDTEGYRCERCGCTFIVPKNETI